MSEVITKYAIIDHIGQIPTKRDLSKIYGDASFRLEQLGFQPKPWKEGKNTFTLREACILENGHPTVTESTKNYIRSHKSPQVVLIICDSISEKAERTAEIWRKEREEETEETNNIYIEFLPLNNETYSNVEISLPRRIAMKWGNALGWTFSAPLFREQQLSAPDLYVRNTTVKQPTYTNLELTKIKSTSTHPEHFGEEIEERVPHETFYHSNETYDERFNLKHELLDKYRHPNIVSKTTGKTLITRPVNYIVEEKEYKNFNSAAKISTKPYKFRKNNLIVASEEECIQFFIYYMWLRGYDQKTTKNGTPKFNKNKMPILEKSDRKDMIEEFLAEGGLPGGWILCPHCGSPVRNTPSKTDVLEHYNEQLDKDGMAQCSYCDEWIELKEGAIEYDTFYDDSYESNENDEFKENEYLYGKLDRIEKEKRENENEEGC